MEDFSLPRRRNPQWLKTSLISTQLEPLTVAGRPALRRNVSWFIHG